jgi:hypothetical protein
MTITLDAVRDAAKAAVAERGGGYIYKDQWDTCRNTQWVTHPDGKVEQVPGCIVGFILHKIGVPLATLDLWNDTTADDLLHNLDRHGHIDGAETAVQDYLVRAQIVQDTPGQTWGSAYLAAEAEVAGRVVSA